ncbi:hypothetical protein HK097_008579 [Rhizophlyctis rosea]|uniref:Uncharacterized protein n=1 Tax=Rhizophlyctis rosea TaxID=64517 RepID=A0AAD5X5G1_9FUNG|nr:hypothetical protein HK097_008579 [Rhizophlyctis rosea]
MRLKTRTALRPSQVWDTTADSNVGDETQIDNTAEEFGRMVLAKGDDEAGNDQEGEGQKIDKGDFEEDWHFDEGNYDVDSGGDDDVHGEDQWEVDDEDEW